jgi:alcohol dehydrogenase
MIADALGANVVAVDIDDEKLEFARSVGAADVVMATNNREVVEQVLGITRGGAHVSLDALGSPDTCVNSIASLRKRGKHVQVGLMAGDHRCPSIPMDKVIAQELEIYGSHGIQAYEYPAVLAMIERGKLKPQKLIGKTIRLEEAPEQLADMNSFPGRGVTVINEF